MRRELSRLYPRAYALDLANAAEITHPGQRLAAINRIVDRMADAGLCRRRDDTSRLGDWQLATPPGSRQEA